MSQAIHKGPDTVKQVLTDFPDLVNEVTTGGARPLHLCGMSQRGQYSTQTLIDAGADLHVLDTYNYNALHRMASNNLDVGATALVNARNGSEFQAKRIGCYSNRDCTTVSCHQVSHGNAETGTL